MVEYGLKNLDDTADIEDKYERASAYMQRAQLEASQDMEEIYATPGMAKLDYIM